MTLATISNNLLGLFYAAKNDYINTRSKLETILKRNGITEDTPHKKELEKFFKGEKVFFDIPSKWTRQILEAQGYRKIFAPYALHLNYTGTQLSQLEEMKLQEKLFNVLVDEYGLDVDVENMCEHYLADLNNEPHYIGTGEPIDSKKVETWTKMLKVLNENLNAIEERVEESYVEHPFEIYAGSSENTFFRKEMFQKIYFYVPKSFKIEDLRNDSNKS